MLTEPRPLGSLNTQLLLSQRWQLLLSGCRPPPLHKTACSGGKNQGTGEMRGHHWDPGVKTRSPHPTLEVPKQSNASSVCSGPASLPRIRVGPRGSGLTHSPFVGVPSEEPSSEGRRFMALLDQHDGCGLAPPCWVGLQVLLAPGHSLLLLTCSFPKPQEDLAHRGA